MGAMQYLDYQRAYDNTKAAHLTAARRQKQFWKVGWSMVGSAWEKS